MADEVIQKTLAELKASSQKHNFDQIISDLKAMFQRDATVEEACRFADINPDTYYVWRKASEEFARHMDLAQDHIFTKAKDNLTAAIQDGDKETSRWLLERRRKQAYGTRTELTGADGEKLDNGVNELREIASAVNKLIPNDRRTETTSSEGSSEETV